MEIARTSVTKAQQWQKAYFDKHHRDLQFGVGESVLLSTKNVQLATEGGRKLAQRWMGPFRVAARVGPVAYRLDLPAHWKIHNVFHVSLLKQFKGDPTREVADPLPILVDGSEEWEVEQIVKHRGKGERL